MKVKIKFNVNTDDNPYDLESIFDTVSFCTVPAETVEDWASAAIDFACTAGKFDAHKIVQNACFLEGGWHVKDWDYLVSLMCEESREKLRLALDAAKSNRNTDATSH
jgi:hypothetical protein